MRIPHPGLSRQMDHHVKSVTLEELLHLPAVLKIHLMEFKIGEALQLLQAIPLQGDVIVVVDVIQTHHLPSFAEQAMGQMKADKAGASGYQYGFLKTHGRSSSPLSQCSILSKTA